MDWPITAGGIAAGCAVLAILGKLIMVAAAGATEWVRTTIYTSILEPVSAIKRELVVELNGRYPKRVEVDDQFRKIEDHLRRRSRQSMACFGLCWSGTTGSSTGARPMTSHWPCGCS